VIIVLGEGIIQVTLAASEVRWDLSLLALTTGAFVLLVGVWALSLVYGFAGVPHLAADVLPARIAMALHCFTTGAIAALGAGLGAAVAHPHGDLATSSRWLLAATVAVYFGISTVTALATHASKRWLVGWALPCTVIPLVLGGFGGPLGAAGVVWALAAVVAWQLIYENRADAAAAAAS
jgi:low temperature requirement protein LtrA